MLDEKVAGVTIHTAHAAPWIYVASDNAQAIKRSGWVPKLYICVQRDSYFKVIERLIAITAKKNLNWKFCSDSKTLYRPDKIVLYFADVKELKQCIKSLRSVLKDARFHTLAHVASTEELGWEKQGSKGIFVGADPMFLKARISWRIYRCYAIASIRQNKAYWIEKPGGIDKAYSTFNLSTLHEGPLSFKPNQKVTSKIEKLWTEIL